MARVHEVESFQYGLIDTVEDKAIPEGASSSCNNWLTEGSHIELRRGFALLGQTENSGTVGITGLHVGVKKDGTQIPYRSRGKKVEYYDSTTDDWIEVGTDILGDDAEDEEIRFTNYENLAGAQVWFSSPNAAGLFKILAANPANAVNQYDANKNFKGYIRSKVGRMYLWRRGGTPDDLTSLYGSKIDKDEVSDYTLTSAEVLGSGDGSEKTFTGTLSNVSGFKTAFGVSVTDSTETFNDDGNGLMLGSLGGTGTINYATGAISVTFNTAPTSGSNNVTTDYYTEDATTGGVADFTFSATRVAGEGFVLLQPSGETLQDVLTLADGEYCFHERATYVVTLSIDDADASNFLFRGRLGIPNHRAAAETSDGIYYVDDTDEKDVHFRILEVGRQSGVVEPRTISKPWRIENTRVGVDLSAYRFDRAAAVSWGKYILFACRTKNSTVNDTVFVVNRETRVLDVVDYFVSCFSVYNGTLIAGDSLSDNVYTLFSGFDDDDSNVTNTWEGNLSRLEIDRLKRNRSLEISGLIGPDQQIRVSLAFDNGSFEELDPDKDGTPAIDGDGDYVDSSQSVSIGAQTLGEGEIGGGSAEVSASPYLRRIKVATDKFHRVKIRFEAVGIGFASVSGYRYADIRVKEHKPPSKYRV